METRENRACLHTPEIATSHPCKIGPSRVDDSLKRTKGLIRFRGAFLGLYRVKEGYIGEWKGTWKFRVNLGICSVIEGYI